MGAFGDRWLMSEGPASTRNKPHSIYADNDGNLPVIITIVNSINAGSHSLCVEVKRAQKDNSFRLKLEVAIRVHMLGSYRVVSINEYSII